MPIRSAWFTPVLCLLLSTLGTGGCQSQDEAPPLTARSLPWVSVTDGRLQDSRGRQVYLRGINARIEGIFDVTFDDGRQRLEPIPEFTREDARAMASAGMNVLRLCINWSGLEPVEGQFEEAYLERVDQVIDWCAEFGIYVLVDFHQDAYSKEIGEDGAPLWAIVPEPTELLEGPMHDLYDRRLSAQVNNAFVSFFLNRENIQDRFLPAWTHVIRRYKDRPEVIGFELMNEPVSFITDPSEGVLHDFYEKFAAAMREVDTRHTLWLEPDTFRNQTLASPILASPFPDDNVVYCPHLYPFNANVDATSYEGWVEVLTETMDRLLEEAESWGAAPAIGEWGARPDGGSSDIYINAVRDMLTDRQIADVFWLWKENSQGSWGFYDYDEPSGSWSERALAFERMATPYAMAVPGQLVSQRLDRTARRLTVEFTTSEAAGDPLIFVGRNYFAADPVISVDGAPVTYDLDPDTHRALVHLGGAVGSFRLTVE